MPTTLSSESGNKNVDGQTNGQTNGQNYTNFKRNLAMMVIYLPLKFKSIGQTVFELESINGNVDGQTDKKQTKEQTELHQFRKEPSYDGDQTVFELEFRNENVDGQTDVGHINLIGGLVTRNLPKNLFLQHTSLK